MHKDFQQKKQDLERNRLDILGEQFILDSQLETINRLTSAQVTLKQSTEKTLKEQQYTCEKNLKDTAKLRHNLESDLRTFDTQIR